MPTFDTPEPISVTLEVGVGDIRIVASDRTDTIVDVRPSDPAKRSDVTAAEQTRVEYAKGRVLVKAPKGWRQWSFRGGGESIDVEIGVPAGSQVVGGVRGSGVALHRSHRRMPLQGRRRRHPARRSGAARPQDRCRRYHAWNVPRRCPDHHGFRRRGDRQHQRRGGGQELQRRHADRGGHGRRRA